MKARRHRTDVLPLEERVKWIEKNLMRGNRTKIESVLDGLLLLQMK